MKPLGVAVAASVDAPPDRVFAVLADYRRGHPSILPPRYFTGLEVERGGVGGGTVIRYGIRVAGRVRHARAAITEPVPGSVLAETDLDSGLVTTFTVSPHDRSGSRVEIATDLMTRTGLLGAIERAFTRRFLQRVYREELGLLARHLRTPGTEPS